MSRPILIEITAEEVYPVMGHSLLEDGPVSSYQDIRQVSEKELHLLEVLATRMNRVGRIYNKLLSRVEARPRITRDQLMLTDEHGDPLFFDQPTQAETIQATFDRRDP